MEQQAAHYNTKVDRDKWRLVGMVHCAETMEQAYHDVEYGIEQWFDYFQTVAAFPQMAVPGSNVKEMISFVSDSGFGAISTPDMVNAQIDRLWKQSNGGFGAYLMLAHNWANFDATRRSYDLVARHVFPRWQGQTATEGGDGAGAGGPNWRRFTPRPLKRRRSATKRRRQRARIDGCRSVLFVSRRKLYSTA